MSKFFSIDGRNIGEQYLPYVIAEMSANHNGDINNAFKIMDMARLLVPKQLRCKPILQILSHLIVTYLIFS